MSAFSINNSPAYPFTPDSGKNSVCIAGTTTSASATLSGSVPFDSVLIFNQSTATAWVTITKGTSAAAFPTSGSNQPGFPVGPGATITVSMPTTRVVATTPDTVNVVLSTGTGNVYLTPGTGQ